MLLIFNTCQHMFGVSMQRGCDSAFPGKEGGIEVLVGIAPLSQTVLKKTMAICWQEKFDESEFSVFTSIEKNTLNYF